MSITPLPAEDVSDGKVKVVPTDEIARTSIGRNKALNVVPMKYHDNQCSAMTTIEREKVESILFEDREAFAESGEEIGHITDPMQITLTDENPIKKRYNKVPKPLYPEIKAYIEGLLNRGWITEST